MKPLKIFSRLTPLVLAATLLQAAAPASHAQRRRARAQTRSARTQRTNTTAPARPAATPPNVTSYGRPPAPTATPGAAPNARPADEADERRRPEPDLSLEQMVSADSYGAYVEVRNLGTLAQAQELRTALGSLKLIGGSESKPLTDVFDFLAANAEPLAEARAVVLFMPARGGIPRGLLALELPTPREAAAFEPKFRRFADEQIKGYASARPNLPPVRRGARNSPAPASGQDFPLTRIGRVIFASDTKVSAKRLRGDEAAPALVDAPRFQAARTRFASDSVFAYVDTGVAIQGWTRTTRGLAEGDTNDGGGRAPAGTLSRGPTGEVGAVAQGEVQIQPPIITAETAPKETPDPEGGDEPEEVAVEGDGGGPAGVNEEALKPSEEQLAVAGFGNVLRSLWGGMPRIPGSFAFGARLDGEAVALRLAVDNSPDGRVNVLPFLPNVVAGPPVTTTTAEVAPADSDIFLVTTLDWEQVYVSTLGTAEAGLPNAFSMMMIGDTPPPAPDDAPRPAQAVAAVEKLFGFKFKEDLLPALGNELAVSMPFDEGDSARRRARARDEKKQDDSEPGFVVILSLNDPDKIREILPRVLVALGMNPLGWQAPAPEKREGFEIRGAGSFSYAVVDRFLVLGSETSAVRHVVDSYAARRTLASADSYRDATRWQAPQKLVLAYLSDSVMRATVEETRRNSGTSTDAVVRALLDRLETPAEAASFETTNEGDALVHQARLPLSMLRAYSTAMMINVRDAPVQSGERMATYVLNQIEDAEVVFKGAKKKGRFGTLEELAAEKLFEKELLEHLGYRVEVNAVGDRFEATATPKEYGKTGRRSFFVDETGKVRGADHGGKPATASDPPVD